MPSKSKNSELVAGSFVPFICSIVVLANVSKETVDEIGLTHMYEYILSLLIVSATIIGSVCLCGGICSCIAAKTNNDSWIEKVMVMVVFIAIVGLFTILVFLGFTYHYDESYTIIFYKTFWSKFKGDYSGDISNIWAYKMMEVLVKLSGGACMIIFVILAIAATCMGSAFLCGKCCGDDDGK
jgi:hypothetical protein